MKMSRSSSLYIAFGSLFAILLTSVLIPHVEAQKGAKRLKTAALTSAAANVGLASVVINELDADQVGTDAAEFVELKTFPGANLGGLVLVFYNGSSDLSYAAYDLDGLAADSNGFVILGNAAVPGVDVIFASDGLQNGQDAVALYAGDATSFPTNTPVTTTNLIDAVVYDTADADDAGLLVLLNAGAAQVQVDENGSGTGTAVSIQRCGAALRDGRAFILGTPSANGANACPTPQPANVDMNGDGFTDFVLVRESVPQSGASLIDRSATKTSRTVGRRQRPAASIGSDSLVGGGSQLEWWIDYNNAPGGVSGVWGFYFGDQVVSADFDGDGTDDVAIWRPVPGGESGFYSIDSSDLTFRYSAFGLSNDNPTVVGDYDGDGFDDPATFRCPEFDEGQCYFFYRGSLNNPTDGITYVPWGFGTSSDYYTNAGDFDGDGKYDFCLMDVKNPAAVFWLWLNGTETREATQWGIDTDFVVPGDYDGDGKSDYAVMRIEADDTFVFYILERDGGMRAAQWGIFGDVPAPGDYDGDGKQDIAVHRWNDTDTTFWILPSNGDPYWTFNYGIPGDEPVARWYVQ